jgi:cytidylate kinase
VGEEIVEALSGWTLKARRNGIDLKEFQSHLESMKEISVKIDDELYRRASRKVTDLEAEVSQHVTEYLEGIKGDDDGILAARAHMSDLLNATRNFGVGVVPSREERHERGTIH